MYEKGLVKTQVGSVDAASTSVKPYEPCLVESVGRVLLMFWSPLAPTILSHHLLRSFLSFTYCWLRVLASASISN